MILRELTVNNFRQFLGEQRVAFCSGPNGPNVTVIFGENGRGKTGLFRALVFCLYGQKQLPQDEGGRDERLLLVNKEAVSGAEQSDYVEASVTCVFEAGAERYEVMRSLIAIRANDQQKETVTRVVLRHTDGYGNTTTTEDVDEIASKVQSVLDPRIKDYFLFDGERMETLTRATKDQQEEVRRGIRSILDIGALEAAEKAAQAVIRDFRTGLDDTSDAPYMRVTKELEELTSESASLESEIRERRRELEERQRLRAETEGKLAELESVRGLLDRQARLQEDLQAARDACVRLTSSMRDVLERGLPANLVASQLQEVYGDIEAKREKGEVPSDIRRDFVARLLEEEVCICGRSLNAEDASALREVRLWLELAGERDSEDSAIDTGQSLSRVLGSNEERMIGAEGLLREYGAANAKARECTVEIERLSDQIGIAARKDAYDFGRQYESVLKDIERLVECQGADKSRLESIQRDREKLEAERKKRATDLENGDLAARRHNLAQDVLSALRNAQSEFVHEVSAQLGKYATEYAHEFLDDTGRKAIAQVVVEDGCVLQVLDESGHEFLANISAGQRQLVSVAFIAALIRLGSEANTSYLEVPLFMDTPFGRLSEDHRRALLRRLPELCSQWVLLATDTEFTRSEALTLESAGNWGCFYQLMAQQDGSTQITEVPVAQALTRLKGGID